MIGTELVGGPWDGERAGKPFAARVVLAVKREHEAGCHLYDWCPAHRCFEYRGHLGDVAAAQEAR